MNLFRKWIELKSEQMGIITPRLVATIDYCFDWDDEDGIENEAKITFFLQEFPSGRRQFEFSCTTGYEEFLCDQYSRDVMVWRYGGPLPKGADNFSSAPVLISLRKAQPDQ